MKITLTLNGVKRTDEVAADLTLQQYLRQKGCMSVKCGCETGNCGLCTVHLDLSLIHILSGTAQHADHVLGSLCRREKRLFS